MYGMVRNVVYTYTYFSLMWKTVWFYLTAFFFFCLLACNWLCFFLCVCIFAHFTCFLHPAKYISSCALRNYLSLNEHDTLCASEKWITIFYFCLFACVPLTMRICIIRREREKERGEYMRDRLLDDCKREWRMLGCVYDTVQKETLVLFKKHFSIANILTHPHTNFM